MAAILIVALIAARNANNNNQYATNSRPGIFRNIGNRNTNSRRIFRVRNTRRGFGGRFQRY